MVVAPEGQFSQAPDFSREWLTELEERIKYYEKTGDTKGFSYESIFADSIHNKTLQRGLELKINGVDSITGRIV